MLPWLMRSTLQNQPSAGPALVCRGLLRLLSSQATQRPETGPELITVVPDTRRPCHDPASNRLGGRGPC